MRGEKKSPRQRVAKFKALMQNFGRFPFLKNRDPTGRTNFLKETPPLAVRGVPASKPEFAWGGLRSLVCDSSIWNRRGLRGVQI